MLRRLLFQSLATATKSKKIQTFFIGDSITMGVGTTGTGFAAPNIYGGANCYAKQTIGKLSALDITGVIRGFSGQYANWFIANDLSKTIGLFDFEKYTDVFCILYFGTNDLSNTGGQPNRTALQFQSDITALSASLKAAGAKVIIVPPLDCQTASRDNTTYNLRRATYNNWLLANYSSIADGLADTSIYANIYNEGAANNAIYFADTSSDVSGAGKIHPTDVGAELIAQACADAITTLSTTASIPVTPIDSAAQFIAATRITDSTIISAINTLVTDLKTNDLWHRLPAIYPFVGGTAASHKFNLRDPRDVNEAYRLVYTGTATHDANGVTWVSGAYADTNYIQTEGLLEASNFSLHYYSRTLGAAGTDIGCFDAGLNVCWLGINRDGQTDYAINIFSGGDYTPPIATGLFCASRSVYTQRRFLKNGVLLLSTTDMLPQNQPTNNSMTIANANVNFGYPSNRNSAYVAIGYGLTDAEEALHYTIVHAFQVALGRAV